MKLNDQPIEKPVISHNGDLEVNSIFYTIQGEGPFAGRPAVFIRLAGCNLQCPFCDTEYTKRTKMASSEIVNTVKQKLSEYKVEPGTSQYNSKTLVVITGGEPFRQSLRILTDLLILDNFTVQIETNGTLYQELDEKVWIVCSPKTTNINPQLKARINAFKYVVSHDNVDSDGLPIKALGHACKNSVYKNENKWADTYIQPADNQDRLINHLNLKTAIKSAMKYNRILCVQVHKQIGVD